MIFKKEELLDKWFKSEIEISKLSEEEILCLIDGSADLLREDIIYILNEVGETVEIERGEPHRWVTYVTEVKEIMGRFFEFKYGEPNTEMQDYDYSGIGIIEVFPKEITIKRTAYVRKENLWNGK